MKQLILQSLNGFTLKDIPFFLLQMSVAAILTILIKYYWRKNKLNEEEVSFVKYMLPVQLILTSIAIFSIQSPWLSILFGIVAIIPMLGSVNLTIKSRVFYLLVCFISYGVGAANLFITCIVVMLFIVPLLHFYSSEN